jgi:hypothetical protein
MSVVDVKSKWSEVEGDETEERLSQVEVHSVLVSDAIHDDGFLARQAPGITPPGAPHPTDAELICRRLEDRRISPTLFEVRAFYEKLISGEANVLPWNRAWKRRWGSAARTERVESDAYGAPLVNKNGALYDNLTSTFVDRVLYIRRNQETFNPALAVDYDNVTNSDFFYSNPGQALMLPVEADEVTERFLDTDITYWQVLFQIQFRRGIDNQDDGTGGPEKAWYRRVLHLGWKVRHPEYDDPIPARDPLTKELETRPVRLDAGGYRLSADAEGVYLEFPKYVSKPFSTWGLT